MAVGTPGSQALAVNVSGGSMGILNGVIRIEAAVTVGYESVPASFFSGTADLIVETDGKILLNVYAMFGQAGVAQQTVNFKLYADLSQVTNGSVDVLFYFENDIDVAGKQIPQLIIAGGVQFGYVDASGNFISPGSNTPIAGFGIKADAVVEYSPIPGLVTLTLTGEVEVVFSPSRITVSFDATLSVSGLDGLIQANNIVVAAGEFVADYSGGLSRPRQQRIYVYGVAELEFTTGSIPFLQPGRHQRRSRDLSRDQHRLQPADRLVQSPQPRFHRHNGNHHRHWRPIRSVSSWSANSPSTSGRSPSSPTAFSPSASTQTPNTDNFQFDMFLFANLDLGVGGQTLFTFDALGLLVINNSGFAAELALMVMANNPIIAFDFNFTLFINTTAAPQS